MAEIDVSTELCGIKLKNPVISGASELAYDLKGTERLIRAGVGGVITKTYTTVREVTRRPRPYQITYMPFGKAYSAAGSLFTMACPDCTPLETTIEQEVPRMAQACKEAGVAFIVTFFCHFDIPEEWADVAMRFERAGAQALELNFSCPDAKKAVEENPDITRKIIEITAKAVNIPVGPKIGPELEPLEKLSKMWVDAGAQFISAHNAPSGILIDLENEVPYGAPMISGYIIGRPFLPLSLARIIRIHKALSVPTIGIGGIHNGEDCIQYIICGSPAVCICTAVFLRGTRVIGQCLEGMKAWMAKKRYSTIESFRGKMLPKVLPGAHFKAFAPSSVSIPPETPYIPFFDLELCTLCGDCARACDVEAITCDKDKDVIAVKEELCWSCGLCVSVCRLRAVKLVDKRDRAQVVWDPREGMPRPFKKIMER